jgi:hypothetical protein
LDQERYPVYTAQTLEIDSASELLRSIPHVSSLNCHEINENNYRVKKVRGKIKPAISARNAALPLRENEAFSTQRAFFQIIDQRICRRFFASSSCVQQSHSRRLRSSVPQFV